MNIEIANHLVQLRKKNGFSQETLAEKLGLSRQAVSKWERAEASPDTDNLIALAKLYGVSLDELLMMNEGDAASAEDATKTEPSAKGGAGEQRQTEQDENGAPEGTFRKDSVHIGWDGIHVTDDHNEVHISRGGIYVNDAEKGTRVESAEDGHIYVNGRELHDLRREQPRYTHGGRRSIWATFPYPIAVTAAFLLLGLMEGWWHPAWLLFLTIPLYYSVIEAVQKRRIHYFCYPVFAVLLHLSLICFVPDTWTWSWVIYLTVPLFYWAFPKHRGGDEKEQEEDERDEA
ncbi:MAG: helix-turn-helix transcriptional regulator [Acutalibacteraceae bacterium]